MQRHSNVNSSYMNDTMVYFCLVATVIVPLPSLPGLSVGTVAISFVANILACKLKKMSIEIKTKPQKNI